MREHKLVYRAKKIARVYFGIDTKEDPADYNAEPIGYIDQIQSDASLKNFLIDILPNIFYWLNVRVNLTEEPGFIKISCLDKNGADDLKEYLKKFCDEAGFKFVEKLTWEAEADVEDGDRAEDDNNKEES